MVGEIRYSYRDVPTLAQFAASDARIRGILGPFRSGKSSASVVEIARRGVQQKPFQGVRRTRWLVVRNTYSELKDSTIRTMHMWLPPERFGKWHASDHNYTILGLKGEGDAKTEIEVWFRALDRPDHVAKLLSVEVTGAWINEAKEVPWPVIEAIDGRIGQYPPKSMGGPTWTGMWMDTNPPDVDSKWYGFFEERKWLKDFPALVDAGVLPKGSPPEAYAQIFRQPSGRAPNAENLSNLPSKAYYHNLAVGKSPEYIKVFIDGLYGFVATGKSIYPQYNDKVHCRDIDPVEGYPIIRGWDYGLTPSCVFAQELPTGQLLVFDEMVSDNMGVDQFTDDVIEHCNRAFRGFERPTFVDWGDPAGQNRSETRKEASYDIQHAKGVMVQPAPQDPTIRWETVRWLLRTACPGTDFEPRFILHSRCKVLRKGFQGGYHRRRLQVAGSERYSDQADKNEYSHPHDALQYLSAAMFGGILTHLAKPDDDDDYPSQLTYSDDRDRSQVTGY